MWFCPAEDWDMLDVDDAERLTGEEEFDLLSAPLGLSERRPVPEAVHFSDTDPLGASVAMITATNSMEETLLQIGTVTTLVPLWCFRVCLSLVFAIKNVLYVCVRNWMFRLQVARAQWIRAPRAACHWGSRQQVCRRLLIVWWL